MVTWTTREESDCQYRHELQLHKRPPPTAGPRHKGKKAKGLNKKTKAACKARDTQTEAAGRAKEGEGGGVYSTRVQQGSSPPCTRLQSKQ